MGHSQAEKAKSRERILKVASKRIREDGLEGVGVVEIMKQAGLTHGGFYGHFPSQEALISAAIERAFGEGPFAASAGNSTVKAFIRRYLSKAHRDDPATGCAVSALAGEIRHADPETRAILTRHLKRRVETMAASLGDDDAARQQALSSISAMVGALTLARAVDDSKLSDEILIASRDMLTSYVED